MAPVALGVALAADGGVFQVATNTLALIAVTQIAHPLLIQIPGAVVESFRKKVAP